MSGCEVGSQSLMAWTSLLGVLHQLNTRNSRGMHVLVTSPCSPKSMMMFLQMQVQ